MNKGLKNLPDPMVKPAIPRAKPQGDLQRVSPGVYRNSSGDLVRSRGGSGGGRSAQTPRTPSPEDFMPYPLNMGGPGNRATSLIGPITPNIQAPGMGVEGLTKLLQEISGQQPSGGQDMGNAIGEFLASGRQVTPAQRPVGSRAPEARQVGNSIGEFLRRR